MSLAEAMMEAVEACRRGDNLDGIAEEHAVHPRLIVTKLRESFGDDYARVLRSQGVQREQAAAEASRARALIDEQAAVVKEETWLKPGTPMTAARFKRIIRGK